MAQFLTVRLPSAQLFPFPNLSMLPSACREMLEVLPGLISLIETRCPDLKKGDSCSVRPALHLQPLGHSHERAPRPPSWPTLTCPSRGSIPSRLLHLLVLMKSSVGLPSFDVSVTCLCVAGPGSGGPGGEGLPADMTSKALSSPSYSYTLDPDLGPEAEEESSQALSCQVTPRLVHE